MSSPFWQKPVYLYVFIGCGLFVLLTVVAMFTPTGHSRMMSRNTLIFKSVKISVIRV
jgi:hypothetical protein